MTDKSAAKSARGIPFTGADDPRRGRGPAKGEGGRPTNEAIGYMRDVLYSEKAREQYKAVMEDKDHPAWATAFFKSIEHIEGRPVQRIEMTDKTPQGLETAEQTAARLLTGIAQVLGVMGLERSQKALMLQKLKGLEVSGEVVEGNGKHEET